MLSFQFESSFQEEKTENGKSISTDNYQITFMPNTDIQDRYVLIVSKLITSEGVRRVEFAEKEMMIVDVRDDVLIFTGKLTLPENIRLFMTIFFRDGNVAQIMLSEYEQGDKLKRESIYFS